ncbi:MAG TPA: dienelactone hydrolase family protein [Roseiarcus sp.]|nr:dienelactone hydrolase family protein [Roseiarcus sp.]
MKAEQRSVEIGPLKLQGLLGRAKGAARGLVIFAHGSGSGRLSPRNNYVAEKLRDAGLATLLLDLLTPVEELHRPNVFDIPRLAGRLLLATEWAMNEPEVAGLPIGYFGASTGAGVALAAAADDDRVRAVVSRGGRSDLAGDALGRVLAPTLLIVGGRDEPVVALNRTARTRLRAESEIVIVPGATHLFEEPGALDQVLEHAKRWFLAHLPRPETKDAPIRG